MVFFSHMDYYFLNTWYVQINFKFMKLQRLPSCYRFILFHLMNIFSRKIAGKIAEGNRSCERKKIHVLCNKSKFIDLLNLVIYIRIILSYTSHMRSKISSRDIKNPMYKSWWITNERANVASRRWCFSCTEVAISRSYIILRISNEMHIIA